MKNTKIEWADHTWNPWMGCTKVSPACDNCYAENLMDSRMHVVQWGTGQPRKRTSVRRSVLRSRRKGPAELGSLKEAPNLTIPRQPDEPHCATEYH